MTELETVAKVATHPLVIQYRKAIQILHRRMVVRYGPDYACPETESEDGIPTQATQKGINRMSLADSDMFNSLLRGAAIIRRDVRNSLTGV